MSIAEYAERSKLRLKGSGEWLLKDDTFRSLAKGTSSSPCLFISGGPGVGKSMLSALAIDYLSEEHKSNPHTSVAYSFFHHNRKESHTFKYALYTIISQIATNEQDFTERIAPKVDETREENDTVAFLWQNTFRANFGPNGRDSLFMIFDGLDEADDEERVDFLKFLPEIVEKGLKIRVGRPEVESEIREWDGEPETEPPIIRVTSAKTIADISRYINRRWERCTRLPKKPVTLKQTVVTTLSEKADGTYLPISPQLHFTNPSPSQQECSSGSPSSLTKSQRKPKQKTFSTYSSVFPRISRSCTLGSSPVSSARCQRSS